MRKALCFGPSVLAHPEPGSRQRPSSGSGRMRPRPRWMVQATAVAVAIPPTLFDTPPSALAADVVDQGMSELATPGRFYQAGARPHLTERDAGQDPAQGLGSHSPRYAPRRSCPQLTRQDRDRLKARPGGSSTRGGHISQRGAACRAVLAAVTKICHRTGPTVCISLSIVSYYTVGYL